MRWIPIQGKKDKHGPVSILGPLSAMMSFASACKICRVAKCVSQDRLFSRLSQLKILIQSAFSTDFSYSSNAISWFVCVNVIDMMVMMINLPNVQIISTTYKIMR